MHAARGLESSEERPMIKSDIFKMYYSRVVSNKYIFEKYAKSSRKTIRCALHIYQFFSYLVLHYLLKSVEVLEFAHPGILFSPGTWQN